MLDQPDHLRSIQFDLENFVGVFGPVRWIGIAWRIGFHECPTAVGCRYVDGQAPVQTHQTSLRRVGQPDLHDSIVADRIRIGRIGPDQDFVAIEVARHVHMAFDMGLLSQEVHIAVEHFNAIEASRSALVPRDCDVPVRGVVETVEATASRIQNAALGVGADFINENVSGVAGQHKVISVVTDVGFAHAADGGIFGERVQNGHDPGSYVVLLDLVAVDEIQHVGIGAGPPRFGSGIDGKRQVADVCPPTIVETEVAVVLENQS